MMYERHKAASGSVALTVGHFSTVRPGLWHLPLDASVDYVQVCGT
jgi:hypothetical protein